MQPNGSTYYTKSSHLNSFRINSQKFKYALQMNIHHRRHCIEKAMHLAETISRGHKSVQMDHFGSSHSVSWHFRWVSIFPRMILSRQQIGLRLLHHSGGDSLSYFGNFISNYFHLTHFRTSLPYNETSVEGWSSSLCVGVITRPVNILFDVSIVKLFLSMGIFFQFCCMRFQQMFVDMTETADGIPSDIKNGLKLRILLVHTIEYHNQVKR